MIQQENMKVCKYEDNEGQIILDKHIYSMSARHKKMMRKKGHLVLRILENRLTSILLLQVIVGQTRISAQMGFILDGWT